ncbi:MAG: V4R domain-containing protein, partial [Candidatus Nanohaloarchaea archaeon]|nr:V4R domain-containing protein [Candidatus Nanohaloarchaea archaeon]
GVRFPSSPTAEEYRQKEGAEAKKTCYFLAGMLTGAAQSLDASIRFNEEECIADGGDACVFKFEEVDTE